MKAQISVAELIEVLKSFPPELLVYAEGCDCIGECGGAEIQNDVNGDGDYVLVERTV